MQRCRGLWVVLVFLLCGSARASGGPLENIPFSAKVHARVIPPGWAPPDTSQGKIADLADALERQDLPSYAVLLRGEDLDPKVNLVEAGDAMVEAWLKQGLPAARHAVMVVAWSEDCGKPKEARRQGHTRCDYSIVVGWGLRRLGIEPARDIAKLAAPFHLATDQSPRDLAGGIQKTLQGIAHLELEQAARQREEEDGSRARALASIDRSILLARHFIAEEGRDDTLQRLTAQAIGVRDKAVSQITESDESLRTYLDSLMRIKEIQSDRRTQKLVEAGILAALILVLLAFVGLRARRRWDAVAAIRDPVRILLQELRARCASAYKSVGELETAWQSLQSRVGHGPKTAEVAGTIGRGLHDLRAVTEALDQHLKSCETLLWQVPFRSLLRLISPCPAQALERQIHKAFPVAVARADGFSLVFNSNVTRVRLTTEEAEKHIAEIHALAEQQIRGLRAALDSKLEDVLEACSRKRLDEVAARAHDLGVAPVWYSTHPLKNRDIQGIQLILRQMHELDPVAALVSASKFRQNHEVVAQRVEAVGEALASVAVRRTPNVAYPATAQLDPEDDPKLTIAEAEASEIKLARLAESPENPEDAAPVQAQAAAVIRLYNKALAQHEALYLAQAQLPPLLEDLQVRHQNLSKQVTSFATTSSGMDTSARSTATLAVLHMQSAGLGIAQATADAAKHWVFRAFRVANKARAEMAQAERCVQQTAAYLATSTKVPSLAASGLGASMVSVAAMQDDGGGDGGTSTGTGSGGGSGGGGGTSSGGGSGGGGGTSSGGGSKLQ